MENWHAICNLHNELFSTTDRHDKNNKMVFKPRKQNLKKADYGSRILWASLIIHRKSNTVFQPPIQTYFTNQILYLLPPICLLNKILYQLYTLTLSLCFRIYTNKLSSLLCLKYVFIITLKIRQVFIQGFVIPMYILVSQKTRFWNKTYRSRY